MMHDVEDEWLDYDDTDYLDDDDFGDAEEL